MDDGHPLAATLADGTVYERWFSVRTGEPAITLADFSADAAAVRAAVVAEAHHHATDSLDIGASFLLGHVAWRALGPLTVPYLSHRRVPALSADRIGVATTVPDGSHTEVTLATTAFVALRGDPAACHPDATVVDDLGTLRRAFRRAAADVLADLVAGLRPWARRSDRVQWGAIGDALAASLWWAGDALGEPELAVDEVTALLDGSPPLWGSANLRRIEEDGEVRIQRVRTTCCLAYRLDAERYCGSCPLVDGT